LSTRSGAKARFRQSHLDEASRDESADFDDGRTPSQFVVDQSGRECLAGPRSRGLLLKYEPAGGFFVAPSGFPFALVGETVPLTQAEQVSAGATRRPSKVAVSANLGTGGDPPASHGDAPRGDVQSDGLDKLLEQQENTPLPELYGEHVSEESSAETGCEQASVV